MCIMSSWRGGLVTVSKQHSGASARRPKVSRRQAEEAREPLAEGGLSHQERRKLRSTANARAAAAARQRRGHVRHLVIVAAGTIAVMAVVAAATGLVSAIEASGGQGRAGTFIVGSQPCLNQRVGCMPPGKFRLNDGVTLQHVQYDGTLPAFAPPGTSVPAILPAGSTNTAYPPHGSRTWVHDLLLMLLVGGVAGVLLWIFPIGFGERETGGAII